MPNVPGVFWLPELTWHVHAFFGCLHGMPMHGFLIQIRCSKHERSHTGLGEALKRRACAVGVFESLDFVTKKG